MLKSLAGYRTYLVAIGIAVAAGFHYLGYLNDNLYQTVVGVLTGGGLASLRAAVKAV